MDVCLQLLEMFCSAEPLLDQEFVGVENKEVLSKGHQLLQWHYDSNTEGATPKIRQEEAAELKKDLTSATCKLVRQFHSLPASKAAMAAVDAKDKDLK